MKKGDRVGAICGMAGDIDSKVLNIFGYGVYEGEEVPPPGIGFCGVELHEVGLQNPKITLDNGQVVWGCECWWGPEEEVKERVKRYEAQGIVVVAIDVGLHREPQ